MKSNRLILSGDDKQNTQDDRRDYSELKCNFIVTQLGPSERRVVLWFEGEFSMPYVGEEDTAPSTYSLMAVGRKYWFTKQ